MAPRILSFISVLVVFDIYGLNFTFGATLNGAQTAAVVKNFQAQNINERNDLSHLLVPLLSKHDTPALGGLVLERERALSIATAGVRKIYTDVNVTTLDKWHMGSCTKAMTATLVARLVETGIVSWTDTVGSIFSRLSLRAEFYSINLMHLLSHHSGIPANADWWLLAVSASSLVDQRVNAVKFLNHTQLLAKPGEKPIYSNWGYTVAGAMLEEVTGEPYETLMQRLIFDPLGMSTAGFGVNSGGTHPDLLTQPWGHTSDETPWQGDNALVMTPAGTVHCSLEDWAKFVSDHLRGHLGIPGLLQPESYAILHTPVFSSEFALAWITGTVDWAKGPVFLGTNNANYALVTVDPDGGIAAISSCNQGYKYYAVKEVHRVMVTASKHRLNN